MTYIIVIYNPLQNGRQFIVFKSILVNMYVIMCRSHVFIQRYFMHDGSKSLRSASLRNVMLRMHRCNVDAATDRSTATKLHISRMCENNVQIILSFNDIIFCVTNFKQLNWTSFTEGVRVIVRHVGPFLLREPSSSRCFPS